MRIRLRLEIYVTEREWLAGAEKALAGLPSEYELAEVPQNPDQIAEWAAKTRQALSSLGFAEDKCGGPDK